jgi:hypothetical protein
MTKKQQTILQKDIQDKCIAIVDQERTNWEDAVSFITPKVGFRMRELIRIFRKNYWGVFDEPNDKNTGREKVWIALVMSLVETWTKNIDLDTKDLGFIARNDNGYEMTEITRLLVKEYLDRLYFGEVLDADERTVLIDGTVVWKTWEDSSSGMPVMRRRTVDLLNFYIDPTEENIQTAYRVTERTVLLPSQLEGMTGWKNVKGLGGTQILSKGDGSRQANFGSKTTGNYRDVWECWGKIPRWLVTGDKKAEDAEEEIDGHIVVSGLESSEPTMHFVEENKKKDKFGNVLKPYEEWRAAKITGRWYGLGVAERVLALQEYLNTIINIRINRSYVSQLGIFTIKKGRGITAQMLNRLPVNGAIQVQEHDDIAQLRVNEASESSYRDEEVIKYWSQQITGAQPISNGDIMPASASATAAATANTNAKSSYTMFKEGAGNFLERWMDRGALPIIAKTIKAGDIAKLTGDDDRWKKLIESIAINRVTEELNKGNVLPTQEEYLGAINKEMERLSSKSQLLVKNVQEIIAEAVDTKFKVSNEDLDTAVTIQNIVQLLPMAPEYRESMLREAFDLMGLSFKKDQVQPQQAGTPLQQGQETPMAGAVPPNLQNIAQRAMVKQR